MGFPYFLDDFSIDLLIVMAEKLQQKIEKFENCDNFRVVSDLRRTLQITKLELERQIEKRKRIIKRVLRTKLMFIEQCRRKQKCLR